MKKLITILAAAIAMGAAAIETSIAYQGVLRDALGNVLSSKSPTITFRLYSQPSGGTALWGRTLAVNLDDTGLFNVELNDTGTSVDGATYTNLVDALAAVRNTSLYVGLFVADSSGEITPRQKILMTPYSSWAADVTNASGDFSVAGVATLRDARVTGSSTLEGRVDVGGDATFNNDVTIKGKLSVTDTGSLNGFGTIPVGGIIMWSGSYNNIPRGWALCDGNHGTPNLAGKFIKAAGPSNIGARGGNVNNQVTLETRHLPAHSHMYAGDDHIDKIKDSNYDAGANVVSTPGGYDAKSDDSGNGRIYRTSSAGSGNSFSIEPEYYALAYIMRIN
jgi:microcystin-dependent protein